MEIENKLDASAIAEAQAKMQQETQQEEEGPPVIPEPSEELFQQLKEEYSARGLRVGRVKAGPYHFIIKQLTWAEVAKVQRTLTQQLQVLASSVSSEAELRVIGQMKEDTEMARAAIIYPENLTTRKLERLPYGVRQQLTQAIGELAGSIDAQGNPIPPQVQVEPLRAPQLLGDPDEMDDKLDEIIAQHQNGPDGHLPLYTVVFGNGVGAVVVMSSSPEKLEQARTSIQDENAALEFVALHIVWPEVDGARLRRMPESVLNTLLSVIMQVREGRYAQVDIQRVADLGE